LERDQKYQSSKEAFPIRGILLPQGIVIPKRGLWREESAVSAPAESRFLADKPGVGMTRGRVVFAQNCTATQNF
jgi:hypothetical protein